MFSSVTNKISQKFHLLDNLHLQHKLMLFSIVLLFAAIPTTVISIIGFRTYVSNASVSTPAYLSASYSASTYLVNPTFKWSCYCVPQTFAVWLRKNDSNFGSGSFWYTSVPGSQQVAYWQSGANWSSKNYGSVPNKLDYTTTYYFLVAACDNNGSNCKYSAPQSFKTPAGSVSNLRMNPGSCSSNATTSSSTFTWSGPTDLNASYYLDYSFGQNPSKRWNSFTGTNVGKTNSYTISNLPTNKIIFWRIWFINNGSSWSIPTPKYFVLCNTLPTGPPVGDKISNFLTAGHPFGIDICCDGSGQQVRSTMTGVWSTGNNPGGYGQYADVWNPNVKIGGVDKAVLVRYSHLSSQSTSTGYATWGTVLGVWGQTGDATGIHVHYETRVINRSTLANSVNINDNTQIYNYLSSHANLGVDPIPFNIDINTAGSGCYSPPNVYACVYSPWR